MQRQTLGISLFILLVLWTAVIFYFSSQPPDISHHQSNAAVKIIKIVNDFFDITDTVIYEKVTGLFKDSWLLSRYKSSNALVRKSAHFGIYFLLGVITAAFGYVYSRRILVGFLLGVSLPVMIAVLDEFNQGFVGRTSSLDDVLIDGAGALVGDVLFFVVVLLVKVVILLMRYFPRSRRAT